MFARWLIPGNFSTVPTNNAFYSNSYISKNIKFFTIIFTKKHYNKEFDVLKYYTY